MTASILSIPAVIIQKKNIKYGHYAYVLNLSKSRMEGCSKETCSCANVMGFLRPKASKKNTIILDSFHDFSVGESVALTIGTLFFWVYLCVLYLLPIAVLITLATATTWLGWSETWVILVGLCSVVFSFYALHLLHKTFFYRKILCIKLSPSHHS